MSDNQWVNKGDWVRFYQGGKLVTGVVEYVRPDRLGCSFGYSVMTDIGQVDQESVIECRSPAKIILKNSDKLEKGDD